MSMYEIRRETIDKIRQQSSNVILFFFDDASRFEYYGRWWIGYFDYVLTEDLNARKKYEELGVNAIHVISGSNKEIYKKIKTEKLYSVTFVGRKFSNREDYINEILCNDIQIKVFGEGWNNFISKKEMIKVFNSSKINLNFTSTYSNLDIKQIKARIFEITMCGGFLLTEYVEDLEKYFEIGKEIDCFHTKEEAVEKIKYYLKNDDIRKKIAANGWERAQNDHSWGKRFFEIFKKIEQKNIEELSFTSKRNTIYTKIPRAIKNLPSAYHYNWAVARLLEGQWNLFKEEIHLSISYNNCNKSALILFLVSYIFFYTTPQIIIFIHKFMLRIINFLIKISKLPYKFIKNIINL